MKAFVCKLLFVCTFAVTIVFIILGVYEQIAGPAGLEKLLEKLHIPLSYNQVLIVGLLCTITSQLLYLFRKKLR